MMNKCTICSIFSSIRTSLLGSARITFSTSALGAVCDDGNSDIYQAELHLHVEKHYQFYASHGLVTLNYNLIEFQTCLNTT